MSTDTSADTLEHTVGSSTPTGIARCESLEGQSEPYTVHGVAIGANEVTHGANGAKFWPEDELRAAVQSLVGVPLTKNHDDKSVESVVGEVLDAGFEPDVGIVFEAEVDEEELATKVARGRLEVSIHAIHGDGGRTPAGELIAEDIRFLDLSLVPRGGSPSNFIEAGESPSEALASLSTDEVAGYFNKSMSNDTDEHESEEEELEADIEAEEAEVEADESQDEQNEAEVEAAELRDEVQSLQAENQELRAELQSVRLEYAEQLSEGSPFEAAELAEKFSFDELREKFDEAEASLVTDEDTSEAEATPAPQTGDTESELSTSDEDADEIAALESKIENYAELGWDAAKADAEERLEELRA